VTGALAELDKPEGHAELARIMGAMTQGVLEAATGNRNPDLGWGGGPRAPADGLPLAAFGGRFSEGFTLGMSKQLQSELGPTGEGPLAKSLAALSEQMSGAAANGIAQGLTPEIGDCNGADRSQCAERRVQQLSRSAAVGFAQGLGAAISIPLFVVGIVVGLLAAFVLFGLVRLLRGRVPA
jgi:hypothetical protein